MARLIFDHDAIVDDAWHPLSGQPAPQYIPPFWIGVHVGTRLIEGLRVLRKLPVNGIPVGFFNSWPRFAPTFADRVQYEDDLQWKTDQAALGNRIRPRPSSIEIARMETVISWPGSYLRDLPQCLTVVQCVALMRSRYHDVAHAAKRLQLPGRIARRWNREGLDEIARGLRRDGVPVF
jgi:hypothetical protein